MLKINDRIKKIFSIALSGALLSFNLFPLVAAPVYASGASLELTNTVDKNLADRGEILSYTITIKNPGPSDSTNTSFYINSLNLADYVSGSGSFTRTATNTTINMTDNWISNRNNFGTVPAGASVIVHYQTKIASNANTDNIVWSVASAKNDQMSDWVTTSSWTRVILKNPGLCAQKTVDKTTATIGETLTYTLKVCNSGNVVLHNVRIFDTLPNVDTRYVDYVPGTTTFTRGTLNISVTDAWITDGVNVGDLNPGAEAFLKFKVTVKDNATDGLLIENVGQFKSDETPNWLQCAARTTITVNKKGGFLKIFKFEDLNGDGVFNTNEQGLPGFQFRIVGEGKDFTITTSAGGVFLSEELPVGTYTISEIVPDNWALTTSNNVKVELKAGVLSEVRFGDKQTGKVLPELPNPGPGDAFLLLLGTVPAGYAVRFLKRKI